MDAIKFVKERNRMCKSFGGSCDGCPADKNTCCDTFEWQEKLVTIVEEWSVAHPQKTRQDVFLEQYPNVPLSYGIINIKPCQIVRNYTYGECSITDCPQCRKKYWLQVVE